MRKVTTPEPVKGGVAGGALPMSAGTSPRDAGSRRVGVLPADHVARPAGAAAQDQAMSPLKSWLVEKPQPQR